MARPVVVLAPNRHFDGKIGDVQFEDGRAEFDADEHPGVYLHCATSGYQCEGYLDAEPGEDEPADAKPPTPQDYLDATVPADRNAIAAQTFSSVEPGERERTDVAQPAAEASRAEWVEFVKLNGFTDADVRGKSKDDLIGIAVRAGIAV